MNLYFFLTLMYMSNYIYVVVFLCLSVTLANWSVPDRVVLESDTTFTLEKPLCCFIFFMLHRELDTKHLTFIRSALFAVNFLTSR